MGFDFRIVAADISEDNKSTGDPIQRAMDLSRKKAEAVAPDIPEGLVIGADTVVFSHGKILGKPQTPLEAKEMLLSLSGRSHTVFTGFTLLQINGPTVCDAEETHVHFRNLEMWEIEDYVASGSPMDKAGAYGIQDRSGLFIKRLEGCYYNVVGFPLPLFYYHLRLLWGVEKVREVLGKTEPED
jgi:septum formation protein